MASFTRTIFGVAGCARRVDNRPFAAIELLMTGAAHCARFVEIDRAMPIYAFHCQACGHDFDRLQKLSDPDPDRCPECGENSVQRKLTAPAFRLAGSGWYETDFKKDGDKKRNLADSGNAPPAAEKSAEPAKPAAKPETKAPAPSPVAPAD